MSSPLGPENSAQVCPDCGGKLNRLPTVDAAGYFLVCSQCDYQQLDMPVARDEPTPKTDASRDGEPSLFKRLVESGTKPLKPSQWPDEFLESLPPDARGALTNQPPEAQPDAPTGEVPSHVKRTLMDYGFAVDEDARGLRLRSPGGLRRPGTGDLSASDVVRLASTLGGAPPPPEERRQCPKCQAVVARTAPRCPWCGAPLPPATPDS
jgi:hypothetical protein